MFQRRMNYVTAKFQHAIGNHTLEQHFGMVGQYRWQQESMSTFLLSIQHSFTVTFSFDLPDDLCTFISSFLHHELQLLLMLTYTSAFSAPSWSVIQYQDDAYINVDRVIQLHNRQYMDLWSPAVTMESDILCLLLALMPILRKGFKKN